MIQQEVYLHSEEELIDEENYIIEMKNVAENLLFTTILKEKK